WPGCRWSPWCRRRRPSASRRARPGNAPRCMPSARGPGRGCWWRAPGPTPRSAGCACPAPVSRFAPWSPGADAMGPAAVRVRRLARWLTVGLCLLHAWVARHAINPDGISYIEVARAYLRGDAAGALNFYWGPLFSWLLAGAFALVPLGPAWEAT